MLQFLVLWLLLPFSFSCSKRAEKTNATKNSHGKTLYEKAKVFYKNYKNDSAYYYLNAAKKQFILEKDSTQVARVYRRIAVIKAHENDFMGSDNSCISGLSFLTNTRYRNLKASFYNRLGLNAKAQGLQLEALDYFNQYLTTKSKKTKKVEITYYNNVGLVYHESQEYDKAIQSFNLAISLSEKRSDSLLIAKLIDNKAWSMYKNNSMQKAKLLLLQAYKTRLQHIDKPGMLMSQLHLATLFYEQNNTAQALQYAKNALKICVETTNPHNRLEILSLLSKIDPIHSTRYFTQYIQLQDSLLQKERRFKNQTAKIDYETEQKNTQIANQKQLLETRKRSLLLGTLFAFILLISAGLFWFQKRKIKGQYIVLDTKNTEINRQNALLNKQHTTISELQTELHHRVKNNLSLIDSLIDEVKDEFDNPKFNLKLTDLQNRIDSMYSLHILLYKDTDDLTHINLKKYVDKLSLTIQHSFVKENIEIINSINQHFKLPVDKAFQIGLIINEFLTNSYKYAFAENEKGIIKINITELPDSYSLTLADNGKGLPKEFDINSITSFGMDVMQLFAKQLQGTFFLNKKKGVSLTIKFPKT